MKQMYVLTINYVRSLLQLLITSFPLETISCMVKLLSGILTDSIIFEASSIFAVALSYS